MRLTAFVVCNIFAACSGIVLQLQLKLFIGNKFSADTVANAASLKMQGAA